MFEFNFNIFQRTSSFGYMMMEFMFISTRVAFGQYFMQRCVAMKTLSQVWVFLLSRDPRTSTVDLVLNENKFSHFRSPDKQEYHWQSDWYLQSDLGQLLLRWLDLQHWPILMAVTLFKMASSRKMIKLCHFLPLKFSKIHQGSRDSIFPRPTLQHSRLYLQAWTHSRQFSSNPFTEKKLKTTKWSNINEFSCSFLDTLWSLRHTA